MCNYLLLNSAQPIADSLLNKVGFVGVFGMPVGRFCKVVKGSAGLFSEIMGAGCQVADDGKGTALEIIRGQAGLFYYLHALFAKSS